MKAAIFHHQCSVPVAIRCYFVKIGPYCLSVSEVVAMLVYAIFVTFFVHVCVWLLVNITLMDYIKVLKISFFQNVIVVRNAIFYGIPLVMHT